MKLRVLDTVVSEKDLPDQGLQRGDIGAVVEVCEPDGLEAEFLSGSGRTRALVTLRMTEVRPIADTDVLAVRSPNAA